MTIPTQDFDQFADDWWNPKGRLVSLHKINPIRFDYYSQVADILIDGLKGRRVLDLGCGGGLLSERFAVGGSSVMAIDLSPMAIEAARRHSKVSGGACLEIDYRLQPLAALIKEAPEKFDVIVCSEVLEHVDDLGAFVRDSCTLLKDGGLYFFSTINKTLKARFFAIFVAEDLMGMLPQGTHDYQRFVRPSTLVEFFKAGGVEVKEIKGMSYRPTSLSFQISKDTAVNYLGYGIK